MKKIFYFIFVAVFLLGSFFYIPSETKAASPQAEAADFTLHSIATSAVSPGTEDFLIYDIELPNPADTLMDVSGNIPADGTTIDYFGDDYWYAIDTNADGNYDVNEPIFYDDLVGVDLMPTSNAYIEETGVANVTSFDASDKVYFEDVDADGYYNDGGPETIWYDVGDTGVFDAGVDWVLVGGATPDCVTYDCVELSDLPSDGVLAYLDTPGSVNGTYNTQKGTAGTSELIFVPYTGEVVLDGDEMTFDSVFLDAADIGGGNDAGGSWYQLPVYNIGSSGDPSFNLSAYYDSVGKEYIFYKEGVGPNSRLNTANLLEFRLYNLGTATDSDLTNVKVWLDDGDGTFETGEDTEITFPQSYTGPLGNHWTFSSVCIGFPSVCSPNPLITATSRRLFVTADIGASEGGTIQMSVGLSGFNFDRNVEGLDGPNDVALTNSGTITIEYPRIEDLSCQSSGQGGAVFLSWTTPNDISDPVVVYPAALNIGRGYIGQHQQSSSGAFTGSVCGVGYLGVPMIGGANLRIMGCSDTKFGLTWTPDDAGVVEQQLVTGLTPGNRYSFAMQYYDSGGDIIPAFSNTVSCYAPSSIGGAVDSTAPVSHISYPASGATVSSSGLVIKGKAKDVGGSSIQKVEISLDGGTSWVNAVIESEDSAGNTLWEYNLSNPAVGSHTIKSRAYDWIGNMENPTESVSFVVSKLTSVGTSTPSQIKTPTQIQVNTQNGIQTLSQSQAQQTLTNLRIQLLNLLIQLIQQLQAQLEVIIG